MKTILHRAESRGFFDHGWLKTHHTFSFADYYNPQRINFGALRVLNDDRIEGGTGFDLHPHKNMEVISIPLKGDLEHQDSLGHKDSIKEGEIQVMSAGTGIMHSEYNRNDDRPSEFLQIWVFPNKMNVPPRYENAMISDLVRKNEICEIVSPYPGTGKGLWIYQQAWFSIADLDKDQLQLYKMKSKDSLGVYIFIIEGAITIKDLELKHRDGVGVYDTTEVEYKATERSRVLFIEVPPHE